MSKIEELVASQAALLADAEKLQVKSRTEALSPEEDAALEKMITDAENLEPEIVKERREARIAETKERGNLPTRPAPQFNTNHYHVSGKSDPTELAWQWFEQAVKKDCDATTAYRLRSAGLPLGPEMVLPVNWSHLNYAERKRTYLTKGGTGTGAELTFQSYSNQIVERYTYASPMIGLLDSESTADGNIKWYQLIDDTSMISTDTSASSGTETAPTIPDTNLVTGRTQLGCKDITSGFQKLSFNEKRDVNVDLMSRMAKASSNSHARKIERDVILATGDGSTDIQGIDHVAHAASSVSAFDDDSIEDFYQLIPTQYRASAIWLSGPSTYFKVRKGLKDDIGNSQFTNSRADQGIEWTELKGHKYLVSTYCPSDRLYWFCPDHYKLRIVDGERVRVFDERFWPAFAYGSVLSVGGVFLGPTGASGTVHSLSLSA